MARETSQIKLTGAMKLKLAILLLMLLVTRGALAQNQVQLQTRDGNLIAAVVTANPVAFSVVDGVKRQKREIAWKDIASIKFVEFQLSRQTDRVEELLQQLSDPEYRKREQAEELLSDVEKFGPFDSLIRNVARDSADIELNYRLQRVLDRLEEYSGPTVGSLDELVFKNGESLRGDAGDLEVVVELLGKKINFNRNNLTRIVTSPEKAVNAKSEPLLVKTFNRPFPQFYKDDDRLISFENLKSGEPTPLGENASEMFVSEGLKFQTEDAGYVGTLWYPFKLCPIDTGKKCICPFDETARVAKRLWGTTLITFCPPGQPDVSAGVKKFGLFLEKVDHSRDIVVEAYNAVGQIIGMVEASDQKCVFAGFEANELITCIRISKNEHLPKLSRRVDPSYAIDCVTYKDLAPIPMLYNPVAGSADAIQVKVGLKNRNQLQVTQLRVSDGRLSFQSELLEGNVECELTNVASIEYNRSRRFAASDNDYLMVQLADSSIVKTEIDNWKQPFDFLDSKLVREQIVGIWSGRNPSRLEQLWDGAAGEPIICFPGCRVIAQDLQLRADGYSWNDETSEKKVQNVKLFEHDDSRVNREESEDPDFTPDVDLVVFRDAPQIPTLWLQQPQTIRGSAPHVYLTDGQYFVLGEDGGFKVSRIGSKNVEIEFGASKKLYPLTRISSIKLPAK